MSKITEVLPVLPDVAGRYDNNFVETADDFLNKLPDFSQKIQSWTNQANNLRDDVNDMRDTTEDYKNWAKNYRDEAQQFKNEVESYVVPDDATYSPSAINLRSSAMTKAEFEALAEARRQQYAGSGFVEFGSTVSGYDSIPSCDGMFKASIDNIIRLSQNSKININGTLLKPFMYSDNILRVHFPQSPLAFNVTDSTSLPQAMKQGDFAVLADFDGELDSTGDFSTDITGSWNHTSEKNIVSYDSSNNEMIIKVDSSSNSVVWAEGSDSNVVINLINNVKYKVKFDYNLVKGKNALMYEGNFMNPVVNNLNGSGTAEAIYVCSTGNIQLFFGGDTDSNGNFELHITNISIKQIEETLIVALQDVDAKIDIYKNLDKFEVRDSVSAQHLTFLEVWKELITDKDIVYPYGNIQYRGNDVDGLTGIAEGTFEGADTYSLFGNWQQPGDLVGKGYVWSNLSDTDKVKLASNPDNNIYKDGDDWVQVRYRMRVVKGLGNTCDLRLQNAGAVSLSNHRLIPKMQLNSLNYDLYPTKTGDTLYQGGFERYPNFVKNPNYRKIMNGVWKPGMKGQAGLYDEGLAIPIALVQRRNQGIYHPTYNPEGCALVYYDDGNGNTYAKHWYEVSDATITSLFDCFDLDKLAGLDSSGNVVKGNDANMVSLTGSIASKLSGRPDGLYADEVNERDVEDLRMDAKKKVFKQGLDKNLNKANIGKLRGKESISFYKLPKVKSTQDYSITLSENIWNISNIPNCRIFVLNKRTRKIYKVYAANYVNVIKADSIGLDYQNGDELILFGQDVNNFINANFMKNNKIYSYTYNNTLTYTDIIGDPRSLQDRIHYTVTSTNETISLSKNEYLLCNDSTNNNGTVGHIYRWLGTALSSIDTNSSDSSLNANVDGGKIDFSDTSYWVDLGSDLTIGGYPQEWIDKGFAGTPLIVGEEGESLLPVDRTPLDSGRMWIKLSKKILTIKQILVRTKDSSYKEYTNYTDASATNSLDYEWYSTTNMLLLNIGNSYSDLGYASEQEMLDLMKVIVVYETKADNMEIANNSKSLLNEPIKFFAYTGHWMSQGSLLANNIINKILTGANKPYRNEGLLQGVINEASGHIQENNISYQIPYHDPLTLSNNNIFGVKTFAYLTQENNRAYLQFVFKEMKYDTDTNTWGDDNKFQIINKVSTTTDNNGKTVLIGQKRIPLNFFITED